MNAPGSLPARRADEPGRADQPARTGAAGLPGPQAVLPSEQAVLPRQHAVLARSTARLLDACAAAAGSTALLCAGAAALALAMREAPPAALSFALPLVLALLPLERLLWLRLRFDAGLFADLALELDRADAAASAGATLDAALHALRLRPPAHAPRPLADRALGARRLAVRHVLVALAQVGLLAAALAPGLWPRS